MYPATEKLSRGGVKTIRRRNNYPRRAQVGQNFKKKLTVPKTVAQCRKVPFSLFVYIEPNYTLSFNVEPNYTLS